jgi:hypothetical protein
MLNRLADFNVHFFVLGDVIQHLQRELELHGDKLLNALIERIFKRFVIVFERVAFEAVVRLLAVEHFQHLPDVVGQRQSLTRRVVLVKSVTIVLG